MKLKFICSLESLGPYYALHLHLFVSYFLLLSEDIKYIFSYNEIWILFWGGFLVFGDELMVVWIPYHRDVRRNLVLFDIGHQIGVLSPQ